jgi:hypothetical protein
MKKYFTCFVLLLIVILAASCVDSSRGDYDKISSPRNRLVPIVGTWEIAGVIENGVFKLEEFPEPWTKKSFQFSEEYALLGDNILDKPRYKLKRVNKEEYFLYGHKSLPKELDTTVKELDVINVTDEDKFLCEIIRVDSGALILEIDNYSLYLKKISDQVSRRSDIKNNETAGSFEPAADNGKGMPRTGVLVGFCSPDTDLNNKGESEYSYRTIWIATTDKKLHPVLTMQDILFPRRSGFWRMEVKRNANQGYVEDIITAHPVSSEQKKAKTDIPVEPAKAEVRTDSITRRIRYVGNDYVSIENTALDKGERTLQVLPIDSLPDIKTVKLSDLSGEAGTVSMEEGRKKAEAALKAEGASLSGDIGQNDSFGLERKMGHWFFKGRINYRKEGKAYFTDYNINVIPPVELIFNDELSIPWTAVKDRVPEAVDVFTSPNKDIALVITRTELIIFGISNGKLENRPLGKTALKAGETVVMAEWATGRYVKVWENSFVGNGGQE